MKRSILELRPTQFALGMKEVEAKVKKLRSLSSSELHDYLHAHPVPVVLSKDGSAHIVDHHHLVRACWELSVHEVVTEVLEDLSHHHSDSFWKQMTHSHWVHPYDQFGKGPHDPQLLPLDIRGLADDVFRSLAWAVREEGGFEKSPEPFSEFKWADYFRKSLIVGRSPEGFEVAVAEALKLASSEEARQLPGFQHRKGEE